MKYHQFMDKFCAEFNAERWPDIEKRTNAFKSKYI